VEERKKRVMKKESGLEKPSQKREGREMRETEREFSIQLSWSVPFDSFLHLKGEMQELLSRRKKGLK